MVDGIEDAMIVLPLVRSLEGLPVVHETAEDVHRYYRPQASFVTVEKYFGITLLDDELGYVAWFDGLNIFPILRVCLKKETP